MSSPIQTISSFPLTQEAQRQPDSPSSFSPPGAAYVNGDSLFPSRDITPPLLPISLENEDTSYERLNTFVANTLEQLQRFPLEFEQHRDRYTDFTPFPFNQVKIDGGATGMNGSWISFPENDPLITQFHKPGKYIAMSAPTPAFFPPFMRMLAQEEIPLIISLTDFKEGNYRKADPYLPYREGEVLVGREDHYQVTCSRVYHPIDLAGGWLLERRDFILEIQDHPKKHYFTQMHLPHWKDFSPGVVHCLANLIKYVYHYRKEKSLFAPIAVHCSAGIGRAGTFINCSESYERLMNGKPVRIFDIAAQSRLQRTALGGNKEQYEILYPVFEKLKTS